MIELNNVSRTFALHNQGGAVIRGLNDVDLVVRPGECVALTGASEAGKSNLMRTIYGNYLAQSGLIRVGGTHLVQAEPRQIIRIRRETLGYVSQLLRVVPRVPTLDVVGEPLRGVGILANEARALLTHRNISQRLWSLSPTTFSGGEQQRINIARGFAHSFPTMLLDEPTASLDAVHRDVVLGLNEYAKMQGTAIVGIFHDAAARDRVCDREIDVGQFTREQTA